MVGCGVSRLMGRGDRVATATSRRQDEDDSGSSRRGQRDGKRQRHLPNVAGTKAKKMGGVDRSHSTAAEKRAAAEMKGELQGGDDPCRGRPVKDDDERRRSCLGLVLNRHKR